jgi:hypothetical protein
MVETVPDTAVKVTPVAKDEPEIVSRTRRTSPSRIVRPVSASTASRVVV